ncbi:MAG: hypothetical protein NWE99_03470 [Candidatus Bathyarchaeota archaeon]|nr:hypothetical protein [Candidatus Bathyarchaeota archaeon]
MFEGKSEGLNMLSDDHITEALTQLGLTFLESKIYLTLCTHGSLSTKTISKLAKMSQPDTYRVLAKLQEKGLIEKLIDRPARFKVLPINESLSFMLKTKKNEYSKLEAKTKLIVRSLEEKSALKAPETGDAEFVLIPPGEAIVNRIRNALEKAERSIDLYLSWKRFTYGITIAFPESLEKAMDRGVKLRIVLESPKKEEDLEKVMQFINQRPCCEIRFFPSSPKTVIGLYDKREAFIIVNPKETLPESPALWSNNQSLISVIQDYFEILWLTAIEK